MSRRSKPVKMKTIVYMLMLFILFAFAGCDDSEVRERQRTFATKGNINADASITAEGSMMIAAPLKVVWNRLVSVNLWPNWWSAVSAAKIRGRMQPGREFQLTFRDCEKEGVIGYYQPLQNFTFTMLGGSSSDIVSIRLTPVSSSRTIVVFRFSREANWPLLLSSEEAEKEQIDDWLVQLRKSLTALNSPMERDIE
jgi:uncharacterized protein YndB with AHSA1/START domain